MSRRDVAPTDRAPIESAGIEAAAVPDSLQIVGSPGGLRSLEGAEPETARPLAVSVRVLGIDASLTRSAFCSLTPEGQTHEVIVTKAEWTLPRRMRALADAAYRIAADVRPDLIVIEEPGFVRAQHGVGPITALCRAQGAIMAGLPSAYVVEAVMVSRMRSLLGVHIPRGKNKAKGAVLEYVEAAGIFVPRYKSGQHDDDVADGYLAGLYAIRRLQDEPRAGTVRGAAEREA